MADDPNGAKPRRSPRKRETKPRSKPRKAEPALIASSEQHGAKIGRKTKRTPEVETILVEAFRKGMSINGACGLAGITPRVFDLWMRNPELVEFQEQMYAAQSHCESRLLDVMHAAAGTGDAKAAAWLLERIIPDDYGRGRRRRPDPPTEQERAEIQDPPQLTMETMQATWIRALQVAEAEFAAGRLDPQHYLTTVTRLSGLSGRALEIASRQADVAEVPPLQISVSLDSPAMVESPTPSTAPGMCGDVIEVS